MKGDPIALTSKCAATPGRDLPQEMNGWGSKRKQQSPFIGVGSKRCQPYTVISGLMVGSFCLGL